MNKNEHKSVYYQNNNEKNKSTELLKNHSFSQAKISSGSFFLDITNRIDKDFDKSSTKSNKNNIKLPDSHIYYDNSSPFNKGSPMKHIDYIKRDLTPDPNI